MLKNSTAVCIVLIFVFNVSLYAGSIGILDTAELERRVNYLERVIQEPLSENSELYAVSEMNNEWMLFSYSFSTFAFTNIALQDSLYRGRAIRSIDSAIHRVLSPYITSTFDIDTSLMKYSYFPDYSVLYLGHINLMLGCYRMLSGDTTYNKLNDNISANLAWRYENVPYHNLESYSGAIWIADNSAAIASLKLHVQNAGSDYLDICQKWVHYVKDNYTHEKTGVLYSTINTTNGNPGEEPRGSMMGWLMIFMQKIDSAYTAELYQNYKKNYSNNILLFRLFREYHRDKSTKMGDIDSGPLFLGYSIPANGFALSSAVYFNDKSTARKLLRLINFGTKSIKRNNEFKYELHFTDIPVSPMAEAIVLYCLTTTSWIK